MEQDESGEVLFSRSGIGLNDPDIWDDTALIQAYDDAVSEMKAKIALKTGESVDHHQHPSLADSHHSHQKHKKNKKKKKEKKAGWAVGDRCSAVFSEDGYVYEGRIKSVDEAAGKCVVYYLGYGNEEEQLCADLLPPGDSRSHHSASAQSASEPELSDRESTHSSMQWAPTTTTTRSPRPPSSRSSRGRSPTPTRGRGRVMGGPGGDSAAGWPPVPQFPSSAFPAPPPPPPPMPMMPPMFPGMSAMPPAAMAMTGPPRGLASSLPPPPVPDSANLEDKDALYSMLMSWYMSGYHTGYYQGLKDGKKQRRESNS